MCNDEKADREAPLLVWSWWWTRVAKTSSNERPEAALTLSLQHPCSGRTLSVLRERRAYPVFLSCTPSLLLPPPVIKILPPFRFYRKTSGGTERGYCDFPCGRRKVGWASTDFRDNWSVNFRGGGINWRDCRLKCVRIRILSRYIYAIRKWVARGRVQADWQIYSLGQIIHFSIFDLSLANFTRLSVGAGIVGRFLVKIFFFFFLSRIDERELFTSMEWISWEWCDG